MDSTYDRMQKLNQWIELNFGPEKINLTKEYQDILSGIEFDRALHLGSGRDKRDLFADLNDGEGVVSFDIDRDGIKLNKNKSKIIGDAESLPFNENSFDLVFSEYVFEHLERPQAVLSEINQILKPKGDCIILVPNPDHYYAKIIDRIPFSIQKVFLNLSGGKNVELDTFETSYEWGALEQITDPPHNWRIIEIRSSPGPAPYSKWLPIHFIFVLIDRIISKSLRYHIVYVVHYKKT